MGGLRHALCRSVHVVALSQAGGRRVHRCGRLTLPLIEGDKMFKRILLATDGSGNARRATRVAIELASRNGSELMVVHAIPPVVMLTSAPLPPTAGTLGAFMDEYYKRSREEARKLTHEAVDQSEEMGVDARGEILDAPEPVVKQIVDFAKNEKVDLIVAGTRGLSGFRKLVLGSVSAGLVSHAPCAVLVVR